MALKAGQEERARVWSELYDKIVAAVNSTKMDSGQAVDADLPATALMKAVVAMAHQSMVQAKPEVAEGYKKRLLIAIELMKREIELGRQLTGEEIEETSGGLIKKFVVDRTEPSVDLDDVPLVH